MHEQAYNELLKLTKKHAKKLKQLKLESNRDSPIDMDILKTTKAMYYELAYEIFKKYEEAKRK